MTAKTEKDKNKVFQEKLQMILCQLLREDDNKYCVDCDTQGDVLLHRLCYHVIWKSTYEYV